MTKIGSVGARVRYRTVPPAGSCGTDAQCPISAHFPVFDVETGNKLFHYIFDGDPDAVDGFLQREDDMPGLGILIRQASAALPDYGVNMAGYLTTIGGNRAAGTEAAPNTRLSARTAVEVPVQRAFRTTAKTRYIEP